MTTPQDAPRTTAREEAPQEELTNSKAIEKALYDSFLTGRATMLPESYVLQMVQKAHNAGLAEGRRAGFKEALEMLKAKEEHADISKVGLSIYGMTPADWLESRFKDHANGQEKSE